jgi:hypothetical protein
MCIKALTNTRKNEEKPKISKLSCQLRKHHLVGVKLYSSHLQSDDMKPKRKHMFTVLVCKLCDTSLETWQLDLLVAAFYIRLQSSRLLKKEKCRFDTCEIF